MAAARQICVQRIELCAKSCAAMQQFLDFKMCDAPADNLIEIKVPDAQLAEKPTTPTHFHKEQLLMKISLLTLALVAAVAALSTPAHAQNYPWCAIYNGGAVGGGTNCGFVSYEQCMATARGLGSFCTRNTQYVPPPGPHSHRPYGYPY
jgi:uncharacterized protein DUF3551